MTRENNEKNEIKDKTVKYFAVFDLDGTILNTAEDLADAVNYGLKKNGLETYSTEEVLKMVGNGVKNLVLRAIGDKKELFDACFKDFKEYYSAHYAVKTYAYNGVKEALLSLKNSGFTLGVLSNKYDAAVKDLAEIYYGGIFDFVSGEKEGMPRKPDPTSLNDMIRLCGAEKKHTVYIGDSDVDVKTADNAGVKCVSVTWGFRSKNFIKENGGYDFADTPEEMAAKIKADSGL